MYNLCAAEGTEKRDEWVDAIARTVRAAKRREHLKISLFRRCRRLLRSMLESSLFKAFIGLLISLNFVLNCIEAEWNSSEQRTKDLFRNSDIFFTSIFSAELLLRMIAFGFSFLHDGWNLFDLVVVGVSAFSLTIGLTGNQEGSRFGSLRVMRALRIVR